MSKNITIQANIEIDDDQLNGVSGGGVQMSQADTVAELAALRAQAGTQVTSMRYETLSMSSVEPIKLSQQTMSVMAKR